MEQKETHSDTSEKSTSRGERSLDWRDVQDRPRAIRGFDGRIQRDSIFPFLLSLGLGGHGRNWREQRGNGEACRLRGRIRTLINASVDVVIACLVRTDPFGEEGCIYSCSPLPKIRASERPPRTFVCSPISRSKECFMARETAGPGKNFSARAHLSYISSSSWFLRTQTHLVNGFNCCKIPGNGRRGGSVKTPQEG